MKDPIMEILEKKIDENAKTNDELTTLNNDILKTKKFEDVNALADDPDIKRATEKISAKALEGKTVNKLFLNQEVFKNKKISEYIGNVLKDNPEIWLFLSADLGTSKLMDKKYEQLSASEKIKILALYDTLNSKVYQRMKPYKNEKNKIDINKFKQAYADHIKLIIDHLGIDFKLSQLSNFGNIKKTLKEEYKLTEKEAVKFIAYLEALKNQPGKVQEAGGRGYIVMLVAGVILGALGMKMYYDRTHPKSETIVQTGRVEIFGPKDISRLGTVEESFKTNGSLKKEQWKTDENDGRIKQQAKKIGNAMQNKEIIMEFNGKFDVQFDLDNSTFEYDYTTKKIYAHLRKPKMSIIEEHPKVIKKNSEVFEIKAFDNVEMQLLDSLKTSVLHEASNQEKIYAKAKENAAKILTVIYGDAFKIANKPFNGVEVIIDVPEPIEVPQKKD